MNRHYDDKISILIRFHDLSKLEQLSMCLLTLEGQTFPRVEPVILAQRFSAAQVVELESLIGEFHWHEDVKPRVINVDLDEPEDLRTHLLNIGIRETSDARFFAVLDYDDFCGQAHYERLTTSLKNSSAAISYSGLILVEQNTSEHYNFTVRKQFVVRDSFRLQNLYDNPHFQMGCFAVDRSKIADADLCFDESIVYEEDYNFHLRLSLRYPSDFSVAAEKVPALMRTIRRDGTNSIVSEYDAPQERERKEELRRQGRTANGRLRQQFFRPEFDPFILYWTEPLPIRGGTAYNWTVYSMGVGMSQLPKRNQYGHLRVAHSPRYEPLVSAFSQRNWAFSQDLNLVREIESQLSPQIAWDAHSVSVWTDLMRGRGPVYELQLKLIDQAYTVFPFQTIMTWGVNGAVADYSRTTSTKHISLELGPTRSPFLETGHCDPFGVNGDSVTSLLPPGFQLPELESEQWLDTYIARSGIEIPPVPETLKLARNNGRKVALIPLQLADDANFLLHAEQYSAFVDFLEEVVPPLLENGWVCIIRPHPGASRADYVRADNERCREWQLSQDQDKVLWYDEIMTPAEHIGFLRHIDAVVSVNSSMAFEAMLLGTPAVVTGKSSFGLAGHMATMDDLLTNRDLTEILKLQRRLVAFNLFHHLVPVGELFVPGQLIRRIEQAERIRSAYITGGATGLAEHLIRNVRSTITEYLTMGISPMRVSPPKTISTQKLFDKVLQNI
ncbi:capsular polysaccharide export protein, LipB/KpsS family [Allorhizobium borbori]|uniref:Capsule polysaccharide biosynthesis protein n=1 Tax=Allorhizobium borbori TaxID=485907 RepID=A0A7W6K7Z1_9HYPH|nr:hypothetical protein [Allorhizobium borbori]MBB4105976.1 hypothetical protein [Allorhizobium borbori]